MDLPIVRIDRNGLELPGTHRFGHYVFEKKARLKDFNSLNCGLNVGTGYSIVLNKRNGFTVEIDARNGLRFEGNARPADHSNNAGGIDLDPVQKKMFYLLSDGERSESHSQSLTRVRELPLRLGALKVFHACKLLCGQL